MNKHIKKLILLMMIMACLLAISTVCAETDNSTDAVSNVAGDSSNEPQSIDLAPQKLSTTYASGKYFKIRAVDGKTKKPAAKSCGFFRRNTIVLSGKDLVKDTGVVH